MRAIVSYKEATAVRIDEIFVRFYTSSNNLNFIVLVGVMSTQVS